uniref:Acidic protein n=1 Tax=Leersia perrieri TaxID=77586 RepID=A0A0D9V2I5_9ORYZ
MAAGRVAVVLGAVVVSVVPLLASGAYADCFAYCYKDCISKDKSMVDYCNYACDKTCGPDKAPLVVSSSSRPLAADPGAVGRRVGDDMDCQLSCAWDSCHRLLPDDKATEICFGRCYDGCKTTAAAGAVAAARLPRPLHAGAGDVRPAEKKQNDDAIQPASEPDPDQSPDQPVALSPPDDVDRHVMVASPPDEDRQVMVASPPNEDDVDHQVLLSSPPDDVDRQVMVASPPNEDDVDHKVLLSSPHYHITPPDDGDHQVLASPPDDPDHV